MSGWVLLVDEPPWKSRRRDSGVGSSAHQPRCRARRSSAPTCGRLTSFSHSLGRSAFVDQDREAGHKGLKDLSPTPSSHFFQDQSDCLSLPASLVRVPGALQHCVSCLPGLRVEARKPWREDLLRITGRFLAPAPAPAPLLPPSPPLCSSSRLFPQDLEASHWGRVPDPSSWVGSGNGSPHCYTGLGRESLKRNPQGSGERKEPGLLGGVSF